MIIDDGYKEWYLDGVRHRVDGPAVEMAGGGKEWWVGGGWVDVDRLVVRVSNPEYTPSDFEVMVLREFIV